MSTVRHSQQRPDSSHRARLRLTTSVCQSGWAASFEHRETTAEGIRRGNGEARSTHARHTHLTPNALALRALSAPLCCHTRTTLAQSSARGLKMRTHTTCPAVQRGTLAPRLNVTCSTHRHGRSSIATGASRRDSLLQLTATVGLTFVGPALAKPLSVVDVDKAKPGELRDLYVTSSGIKYAEVYKGSGDVTKTGDLVLVDVVGRLPGGQVFIDTRKLNAPLAFQIGTHNKYVPEGLSQLVEGMNSGSVRLAVLPPELGYGDKSVSLPGGTVPPNSKLLYEVELLRCQTFTLGLACCTEAQFNGNEGSCIKKPPPGTDNAVAPS